MLGFNLETPSSLWSAPWLQYIEIAIASTFWKLGNDTNNLYFWWKYITKLSCHLHEAIMKSLQGFYWINLICVFVPDFWHHEAMLNHECVANGCHHGENFLAGWIPPHQVQQGVSLMLSVQLVDTLFCDQLHWDSAVILTRGKYIQVKRHFSSS